MKLLILFLLVLFLSAQSGNASPIVLNEILANEPGSATSLEWIELFNPGSTPATLDSMVLVVGPDTTRIPDGILLLPISFTVIARKPLSDPPGSASFEQHWGNNSGVWGDTPEENFPLIQGKFSLANGADTVRLYSGSQLIDVFGWRHDAGDGISWERVLPADTLWLPATNPPGNTPGRINTQSPQPNDLTPLLFPPSLLASFPDSSHFLVSCEVKNVGTATSLPNRVVLYDDRDFDSILVFTESLSTFSVPPLGIGMSQTFSDTLSLSTGPHRLWCVLDPDDRPENNRASMDYVVGDFLPGVVLNEFLPDPTSAVGTEWIELVNRSAGPVNLKDWKIRDAAGDTLAFAESLFVSHSEFLIAAKDKSLFAAAYPQVTSRVYQPATWLTLNNSGDRIMLIDARGFAVDSVSYANGWGGNVSWERVDVNRPASASDNWWRSVAPSGSTPGQVNSLASGFAQGLTLDINPNPFSPDGDGFDDETEISFSVPFASSLTLKILTCAGARSER